MKGFSIICHDYHKKENERTNLCMSFTMLPSPTLPGEACCMFSHPHGCRCMWVGGVFVFRRRLVSEIELAWFEFHVPRCCVLARLNWRDLSFTCPAAVC